MMKSTFDELINELNQFPEIFAKKGKSFSLLQFYLKGEDLNSLIPVLNSNNPYKVSAAAFVLNEMGGEASDLLEFSLKALKFDNRSIKYDVIEFIACAAKGDKSKYLKFLLLALKDTDDVIKLLSMRLLLGVGDADLKTLLLSIELDKEIENQHVTGVRALLEDSKEKLDQSIKNLSSSDDLVRIYSVIFLKKNYEDLKDYETLCCLIKDESLKRFFNE